MPRVARSNLKKAGDLRASKDEAQKTALQLHKQELEKLQNKRRSAKDIGEEFGLPNLILFNSCVSICRAKKGYTNNQLGISWIKKFHDQTKDKTDSMSHYTGEFLDFAQEHNILVMGCFPHCTAVMQGLDVACFGALKINCGNEKDDFEGRTGEEADGGNFLQIYPSPVSAVLDAFHKVRTACDKENSGACPTSSRDRQTSPRRPLASRENTTSLMLTPHVNRMMDGLASTSASFLLNMPNSTPILSRLLEDPTWDMILRSPQGPRSKEDLENGNCILRSTMRDQCNRTKQGEEIIEAQNAQLSNSVVLYIIKSNDENEDEERVAKKQKTADLRTKKAQWRAAEKKRIDSEHRDHHAAWERKRERMKNLVNGMGSSSQQAKGAEISKAEGEDVDGNASEDAEMQSGDESSESSDSEPELESEEDMCTSLVWAELQGPTKAENSAHTELA
ncbi:hypothetical protein B0H17DRAFT_1127173 [Mycena rosella]|uniref:DDE-1 domain-containing protein n=1 Tax=Mycena rosella TaxID=1033263 RepID=A0AAD7DZR7_MYCRO|nr:hypothetical protein B0H17DRAFT_1127173 [Mycena rosella]